MFFNEAIACCEGVPPQADKCTPELNCKVTEWVGRKSPFQLAESIFYTGIDAEPSSA